MKLKNNKGFTLLEIIIVIIIIGVLASLAIPRLFSTVEYSRSAEALNAMNVIRGSIERCYAQTQDYTKCDEIGGNTESLDIEDPGTAAGAHFTYEILASEGGPDIGFKITARRNEVDGHSPAPNDYIVLEQDNVARTVTKTGYGVYKGIK